ncbi:cupredoxin domain-containing protein [Nocardioides taihuensis]|uniref:Blue (type 1) copper domain-containing protein n=1 Tax=Nocardioides taihuensis TaxID=1835606 RepID=A0ABW0BP62_9ACTN
MRARALPAAAVLALALALPSPAVAADRVVTVSDAGYSPDVVRLTLGSRVEFTFVDPGHSATSDVGFFDTGVQTGGLEREWFWASGSYRYHCTAHPSTTGRVRVPPRATEETDGGWLLWWADADAPDTTTYDVQVRRRGADAWRDLRSDTTDASASFDPARRGPWKVRARAVLTASGATSGWSPVLRLS